VLLLHVCARKKYHWNISFQKKLPSKYVVKNARSVTHFVWQTKKFVTQKFVTQNVLHSWQFDNICWWLSLSHKMCYTPGIFYNIFWWLSLSHKMCYTPGIFDNIFRWQLFLERDISMIFLSSHNISRWPENVKRVNNICLHCDHFIHCYIYLNFVLFFSSSWQSVTISNTRVTTEHGNKSSLFFFCLV
jgi:hypothetical protein